jgi:hypothetical protein
VDVTEITEEVLSLVMPRILFQVRSPLDLEMFAETFSAHLHVCEKVPDLHIELDFTWNMDQLHITELGKWTAAKPPTWSGFHEQIRYRVVQRDRTLARVHQRLYDIFKDPEGLPGAPGALHQIPRLQTFGHIPIPHYWIPHRWSFQPYI